MTWATFQDLPLDILDPVIRQLGNRKEWRTCTLVNREFNKIATPLLYQSLDSRIIGKGSANVLHPCFTLINRPELAQYVQDVTESVPSGRAPSLASDPYIPIFTTSVLRPHSNLISRTSGNIHNVAYLNLTEHALLALSLCTSLRSFTWIDDSNSGFILYRFLQVIKALPHKIEEIKIRSQMDIGQETWELLSSLSGLTSVSWFCMDGPPRVLQGWGELLGPTLTHLELGRCAGVPPSILTSVLLQLPKLESLLLKGAPSYAVTNILVLLPNLKHLDTDYLPSQSSRSYTRALGDAWDEPRAPLSSLTVRTSSIDYQGPRMLWPWILESVKGTEASLEVFKLHAFASVWTHMEVPRTFILELVKVHGPSLKQFSVRGAHLTLADVECLCSLFPQLEYIESSVGIEAGNIETLKVALAKGKNLRALKLIARSRFSTRDATNLMLRSEDSKLRFISVDGFQYTGKWYIIDDGLTEEELERPDYQIVLNAQGEPCTMRFIVTKTDNAEDSW